MSDDYCYLTSTGRRTGRPHRIEIWYAKAGNTLYLLSGGGRSSDWVQNMLNDPAVMVEVEGVEHCAAGRVLADDSDEAEVARDLVFDKYAATVGRRPHRLASAITARRARPDRSVREVTGRGPTSGRTAVAATHERLPHGRRLRSSSSLPRTRDVACRAKGHHVTHPDGRADRVPVHRRRQMPDARVVTKDRLAVQQQRLRILERELHHPSPHASFTLGDQRLPPDESVGLVPGDREAEAGLER